jgi:hypothetical protein
MDIKQKLLSRKFWMAVLGAVIPVLNGELGWNIPVPEVLAVLGLILGYILVEAKLDGQRMTPQEKPF